MLWYLAASLVYLILMGLILVFIARASQLRAIGDRKALEAMERKRSKDYRKVA